jgi:hypothetical protein
MCSKYVQILEISPILNSQSTDRRPIAVIAEALRQ